MTDAASGPAGGTAGAGDAERELVQLTRAFEQAFWTKDAAALGRLLADDYRRTLVSGKFVRKDEYIAYTLASLPYAERDTVDDLLVRTYGDAAVVTYRFTGRRQLEGQELTVEARATDVWVRRQGRWQAVASQVTRVTPPPAPS